MSCLSSPGTASTSSHSISPIEWWWLNRDVAEADRPALIGGDGRILSRGELAAVVQSCSLFLADSGIRRGERLARSRTSPPEDRGSRSRAASPASRPIRP